MSTDKPEQKKTEFKSPKLLYVGQIKDMVLGGGGKLSKAGGDTGDNRKPKGGEAA